MITFDCAVTLVSFDCAVVCTVTLLKWLNGVARYALHTSRFYNG